MKKRLEPIGTYDPYRPRTYGTRAEHTTAQRARDFGDMNAANEAFYSRKQGEIAARTRALAAVDMLNIENSLAAEARARRHKVSR